MLARVVVDPARQAPDGSLPGKTVQCEIDRLTTVKQAIQVFSSPFVGLEGSKKATYGIVCETTDKQPWASFAPGQKVKVVGKYEGAISGPALKNCEVTALDPNPAVKLTAEVLAKDFETNKTEANKKYQKKTLIVSGTITSTEFCPVAASPTSR